ncbi:MAG: hypothetical protein ACREML_10940, partial [Vulcanimicrobiaceae bacterium]
LDAEYPTGLYDPRARFGDRPVYASDDVDESGVLRPLPVDASRAGRGSKFSSSSISRRGQRSPNSLPLHELEPEELSKEFDPAHQFVKDLSEKYRKIANEIGKRQLEKTVGGAGGKAANLDPVTGKPMPARVPVYVEHGGQVFGRGQKGIDALQDFIANEARGLAFDQAAKDPEVAAAIAKTGLSPEQVAKSRALEARIAGVHNRLRESQLNEGNAEKLADYVRKRYAEAQDVVGADLWKQLHDRAADVDRLNGAIENARTAVQSGANAARAKQFDAMLRERDQHLSRLGKIAERVEKAVSSVGDSAITQGNRIERAVDASRERPVELAGQKLQQAVTKHGTDALETKAALLNFSRSAERAARAETRDQMSREGRAGLEGLATVINRSTIAGQRAADAATKGQAASFTNAMTNVARAGIDTSGDRAFNGVQRVAQQQLGRLERDSANVYNRKSRILRPMQDASDTVGAGQFTTKARSQVLASREQQLRDVVAARDAFDKKYQEAFERIQSEIGRDFKHAVKVPEGYKLESELGHGSPSAIGKALDQSIFDFLKSNPRANVEFSNPQVRSAFRTYEMLNQLSRTSIVWLPVVHAVDNLGMHFLAEGGTPVRM